MHTLVINTWCMDRGHVYSWRPGWACFMVKESPERQTKAGSLLTLQSTPSVANACTLFSNNFLRLDLLHILQRLACSRVQLWSWSYTVRGIVLTEWTIWEKSPKGWGGGVSNQCWIFASYLLFLRLKYFCHEENGDNKTIMDMRDVPKAAK